MFLHGPFFTLPALLVLALTASSPSLRRDICVCSRKLMTSLAVGSRFLFGNSGIYGCTKATGVYVANLCHDLFVGHPLCMSCRNRVSLQSGLLGKFCKKKSTFWKLNPSTVSAIALLLRAGGPPAIARLIVAVYINAIKRIALWARPHVDNKTFETVSPAFANRDATTSVIPILVSGWGVAASEHSLPDAIERGGVFQHLGILYPATEK